MAFKLRENEELKLSAKFHWSDYIVTGFWAFLFTPVILILTFTKDNANPPLLPFVVIGYGPLVYKILKNRSKKYLITNQRLYLENGILSKRTIDVPLNKINDIAVSQNFIGRFFNVGSLDVMTGNDKGNQVKGIWNPEQFHEFLSKLCNNRAS